MLATVTHPIGGVVEMTQLMSLLGHQLLTRQLSGAFLCSFVLEVFGVGKLDFFSRE